MQLHKVIGLGILYLILPETLCENRKENDGARSQCSGNGDGGFECEIEREAEVSSTEKDNGPTKYSICLLKPSNTMCMDEEFSPDTNRVKIRFISIRSGGGKRG